MRSRSVKTRREARKKRVKLCIIKNSSSKLRLCFNKTGRNIFAQIIDDRTGNTLVSVSSLEKDIYQKNASNANKKIAKILGLRMSEKADIKNIKEVVFDRRGSKYHGVVKVFADAAREKIKF